MRSSLTIIDRAQGDEVEAPVCDSEGGKNKPAERNRRLSARVGISFGFGRDRNE